MRLGQHMTEEQKANMSMVAKEAMNRPEVKAKQMGSLNHSWGIPLSAETKAKQSAKRRGKPGHPMSEVCKRAMLIWRMEGPANPKWTGGKKMQWRRESAKRRILGFHPLNSWFIGCEGHHINKTDVIYVPMDMHDGVSHNVWTGRGMERMNALAYQYLAQVTQ